jgi:TDG/mug DNA glycosylase family protein
VDRPTIDIYERRAGEWEGQRTLRPDAAKSARGLARRIGRGPAVDLGCGPGFYTALLPRPTIALDAARAMLDLVPPRAPRALRVQGDLAALPFRRGAFAGAWGRNSYVHLPTTALPLALAHLHHALRVDAPVALMFFGGDREGRSDADHDVFAGRFFSHWSTARLCDVFTGAGFVVDRVFERLDRKGDATIDVHAHRARTLPDFVEPRLRLLLCGLNPSLYAADAGIGFARPGNRFWPAALQSRVLHHDRDPWRTVGQDRVGMTDLVKRATTGAAELRSIEYRDGMARVERLAAWLQPGAICFLGLTGWRAAVDRRAVAGLQDRTIGGRPVYVMPNPSGVNAHATVDDLATHLGAAAALADRAARTRGRR